MMGRMFSAGWLCMTCNSVMKVKSSFWEASWPICRHFSSRMRFTAISCPFSVPRCTSPKPPRPRTPSGWKLLQATCRFVHSVRSSVTCTQYKEELTLSSSKDKFCKPQSEVGTPDTPEICRCRNPDNLEVWLI